MGRSLLTVVTLVLFSVLAIAQNSPTHVHQQVASNVIDGSKNPEKIPDQLALQFVLQVTGNPADQALWNKDHQRDHINKIGLGSLDATAYSKIADSFRAQFDDIVKRYNDAADVAWETRKEAPQQDNTSAQLDALMKQTIASLKDELTPGGWARLQSHVEREKMGMRVVLQPSAAN